MKVIEGRDFKSGLESNPTAQGNYWIAAKRNAGKSSYGVDGVTPQD
jgi:hypothetical protein